MLAKLIVAETAKRPAKICGVCGDRAKSYHFGGISCDSCKAFFRRSVQNEAHRAFQCSFQKRCDITMANRKCCQHCRFRKCIDIGMETSWVMTEEERVNMLQARLWKRRPPTTQTPNPSPTVPRVKREKRVRGWSSPTPPPSTHADADSRASTTTATTTTTTADDEDLSSVGGDDDFGCPPKRKRILPSTDFSASCVTDEVHPPLTAYTDLFTAIERAQIDGILKAFHDCFRSRTNLKSAASGCSSKWLLVVLFVVSIQRLVRFARNLEPFSKLLVKDQVALLRSNIFEMFLVVHLCDFDGGDQDIVMDASNHQTNDSDVKELDAAAAATPVHRNCPFLAAGMPGAGSMALPLESPGDNNSNESIGTMFRSAIQGDTTTLVLLLLVVLFCPDSDELTNPAVVESHQIYFCNLLGRHLRSVSRFESGSMSLPKLLLFLPTLREMREKHVSFHFDLSDEDVESATSDIVESIEKGFI